MRAFQRIAQVDVGALRGQFRAVVSQGAGHAQLGDGVGADHQLEAVQVPGQRARLSRNRARALLGLHPRQGVFDDGEQIGAGPGGGIERHYVGGGKAALPAEALDQQLVDQPDLGANHLHRRVVGSCILAQLGIVGCQEVLVEVEPGILGARKRGGRHDADYTQQQIEGGGELGSRLGIGQYLQRP